MRTLNIAEDLAATADGSSAAVNLATKNVPFLPNYTAVLALNLQALADAIITVQGSDTSDFSDTPTDYFEYDHTAGAAITKVVFAEITLSKQYIRVNVDEVTTGAGAVSADLLGN